MNKIIEKQLDESFKLIPHLRDGFKESLKELVDIHAGIEIATGVGNICDIDLQSIGILNAFTVIDENIALGEMTEEDLEYLEYDYRGTYTDAEIDDQGNFDDSKATVIIILNEDTYQVIKSPCIGKHAPSSLCYPGQCNLDEDGEFFAYELPEDYKQF